MWLPPPLGESAEWESAPKASHAAHLVTAFLNRGPLTEHFRTLSLSLKQQFASCFRFEILFLTVSLVLYNFLFLIDIFLWCVLLDCGHSTALI